MADPTTSTKKNTAIGYKFYFQFGGVRKLLGDDIASVSPGLDDKSWNTETDFKLQSGETWTKKTNKNPIEFTVQFANIDQSTNEGFALVDIAGEDSGDSEDGYLIAESPAGEFLAIKGTVPTVQHGDYNESLRKPSFTINGNAIDYADVPTPTPAPEPNEQ